MSRLYSSQDLGEDIAARLPNSIFIHFVDHEVLRRGGLNPWAALAGINQLIRIVVVISPEPALLPISARDEHPAIERLVNTLEPLFDADVLHVTGAGSSPKAYLRRRQTQFDNDRQHFPLLFSPAEDRFATRIGSVWVEKRRDTTSDIRHAWTDQILADETGMVALLRAGGRTVTDVMLERLLDIPDTLGTRPLITDVVVRELERQGLISWDVVDLARDTTASFLTPQWLRSYGSDLDGAILRDFGSLLPDARGVLDHEAPSISARRAIEALSLDPPLDEWVLSGLE
jgi:hypothetical protein